jgi:3-methyladenine DNA glycosylase/8-oxoguanine DNA glycosylase
VTEIAQVALVGGGGEPVDFRRTIHSHGVATLPPQAVDAAARSFETTLLVRGRARTVRVTEGRRARARVEVIGRAPSRADAAHLVERVRHMLCLDEDLSGFYAAVADDPELSWAAAGAGRMVRSASVFEDVVKTICTTNCTWSATERMTGAIVAGLGVEDAATARRAFPTPAAMAEAGERFYREVVRAGYRGAYLRALAADVASGALDLEELNDPALPDDEVARRLLALPGVGPYAAAHVMMLIGRYGRLILDSWTRPAYARLAGKGTVSDKAIERRFKRYRSHAGLAFWLFVTRDWLEVADPKP